MTNDKSTKVIVDRDPAKIKGIALDIAAQILTTSEVENDRFDLVRAAEVILTKWLSTATLLPDVASAPPALSEAAILREVTEFAVTGGGLTVGSRFQAVVAETIRLARKGSPPSEPITTDPAPPTIHDAPLPPSAESAPAQDDDTFCSGGGAGARHRRRAEAMMPYLFALFEHGLFRGRVLREGEEATIQQHLARALAQTEGQFLGPHDPPKRPEERARARVASRIASEAVKAIFSLPEDQRTEVKVARWVRGAVHETLALGSGEVTSAEQQEALLSVEERYAAWLFQRLREHALHDEKTCLTATSQIIQAVAQVLTGEPWAIPQVPVTIPPRLTREAWIAQEQEALNQEARACRARADKAEQDMRATEGFAREAKALHGKMADHLLPDDLRVHWLAYERLAALAQKHSEERQEQIGQSNRLHGASELLGRRLPLAPAAPPEGEGLTASREAP